MTPFISDFTYVGAGEVALLRGTLDLWHNGKVASLNVEKHSSVLRLYSITAPAYLVLVENTRKDGWRVEVRNTVAFD